MTQQTIEPLTLRPSQARQRYQIPREKLYNAIHSGALPAINIGSAGRPSFLLRITDIEQWMESLLFSGKR